MPQPTPAPADTQDLKFFELMEEKILSDPLLMFGAKAFNKPQMPLIETKTRIPFARKAYI